MMVHARQPAARRTVLSAAALAGLLAMTPPVSAANSTWGNLGTDFNTDGNWSDAVPGAGNEAIFDSAAVTQPNLSESLSIGKIHFSTTSASGYTLSASPGAALTLTTNEAIRAINSSGVNTISAPLILSGGNKTFTTAPGGTLVISGDITESGGSIKLTIARTTSGDKVVTLSGNNSYSGGTDLAGANGTLHIGSSTALGTGTLNLVTSDYIVDNSTGGPLTLANGLNLNGTTFIFNGTSNMKMTGAIGLGGNAGERRIRVLSNTLHLTGAITEDSNSRPFTKQGAGTLILDGSSNHSGVTKVSAGTLIVNGSFAAATGAVSVDNTGTLGGTGIIGGATSVNSGGTLAPGASPGTLTFASDLMLAGGSSLSVEGGDLVVVDGMLTLSSNWTLALGAGFQDGGSVTLFTYDTLASDPDLTPILQLDNLGFEPSGALSLTDTGGSIVLNGVSVVPEPASAVLAVVGLVLLNRRGRAWPGA